MSRVSPTLPLSHIIASDAPLLSPISPNAAIDQYQMYSPALMDNYAFYHHGFPPSPPNSAGSTGTNSPVHSHRMLRMHMTPDSISEGDQLCIPTHQVFDFPEMQSPPSPESPSPSPQMYHRSVSVSSVAHSKRELSPAPGVCKKARGSGERITTKDFIPPDVSGLSKREARLVKNRAAAFLSRQRKREEFETMEIRVAELEQENAALRLAQNGNGSSSRAQADQAEDLLAEIEQLRSQLAAVSEREQELSTRLQRQAEAQRAAVKIEAADPYFPPSPASRAAPAPSPYKPGASLGLMVLLCALPTLLSMPTHSNLPTSFSLPASGASAMQASSHGFDLSSVLPTEYDWRNTGNGMMDLDLDDQGRATTFSNLGNMNPRKLEFVDAGADALGLGNLDISFDASPTDNGKIRVRIHSSPSAASSSTVPQGIPQSRSRSSSSSSLAQWAGAPFNSPIPHHAYPHPSGPTSDGDPFFGVGASNSAFGLASPMSLPVSMGDFSSPVGYGHHGLFNLGPEFSTRPAQPPSGKRRVRIALKSMPTTAGEGGEWEIEFR